MQSNPYAPGHQECKEKNPVIVYASSSMLPFSETYKPSKNYMKICQQTILSKLQPYLKTEELSYLPDILVSHSADLLDVGGGLGNVLEGVASQLQLILLVL
jgi:hypothetical protein